VADDGLALLNGAGGVEQRGLGVDDDGDLPARLVPADVYRIDLLELGLALVQVHLHPPPNEEPFVLLHDPLAVGVAGSDAQMQQIGCINLPLPFLTALPSGPTSLTLRWSLRSL
jgi:hypothetical protein